MRKPHLVVSVALVAVSLLPWNATALNSSRSLSSFVSDSFSPNQIENLLVKSLMEIVNGQVQTALETTEELIRSAPNFKLAHLVRGDLLMSRAHQVSAFGSITRPNQQAVTDFREEARKRIDHFIAQQNVRGLPEPLWQVDASIEHVAVVDAEKSRLYLYKNESGHPTLIADFYVTLGKNGVGKNVKGDKRTPVGVYIAGNRIQQKLPDFYGSAAYPLNYPNEWDSHQGKTGSGIWIHGTPSNTYSRPPLDSDGCIVMANQELKSLGPILQNGNTLVIVSNNLEWVDSSQSVADKASLLEAIKSWETDWESRNTDQYLRHYSTNFFSQTTDIKGWAAHKRKVQAATSHIKIELSNLTMVRYPDSKQVMAAVSFNQFYQSNAISSKVDKQQYWVQENGTWKILYEGS